MYTRTDPLSNYEIRQYDLNGNATVSVDRKNQVTQTTYDALDRVSQIQFADLSTITYSYDLGNRLTQITDSANGTVTRAYDVVDRLVEELTAQGSVSYTYDAAGRRTTMTVSGQSPVVYAYDNANRLTQLTQGSDVVSFGYDDANRRTSLTLPNGIVACPWRISKDVAATRVSGVVRLRGCATV